MVLIPVIGATIVAIIGGIFGFFGHKSAPIQSNTVSGTNINRSISTVGNQNGNNSVDDHSSSSSQALSVGQNLAPLYAPQTTVNNYYGPISNTVTREAFELLESKVVSATNTIELTGAELRKLAQALRDLDQRTSDIEKLPDGRTKFGEYISGKPKVVIQAFNAAIQSYTNADYAAALKQAQQGIEAFETTKGGLIQTGGGITKEGKAMLYGLAAESAWKMGNNLLANGYAEKSAKTNPTAGAYFRLSDIQATLGRENLVKGKADEALIHFRKAIDSKESGQNAQDFQKESLNPQAVTVLYAMAAESASRCGSNDLALKFSEKIGRLFGAGTNTTSQLK